MCDRLIWWQYDKQEMGDVVAGADAVNGRMTDSLNDWLTGWVVVVWGNVTNIKVSYSICEWQRMADRQAESNSFISLL